MLMLGVLRAQPAPWQQALPLMAEFNDQGVVRLTAEVVEDPFEVGVRLRATVSALWVETPTGREKREGKALVYLPPAQGGEPGLRPGDHVLLRGSLEPPPMFEGFDYRAYLARQGVSSVMYQPEVELLSTSTWSLARALSPWRHRLARSLEDALPEPEGALARTLVLGIQGALPPSLAEAFRITGTSHILAISGLNIALVMGILVSSTEALLGRRRLLYLAIPFVGVWLYALLAGMAPSVSRAAVMGSLYLAALALGRQSSLPTALALTAAGMAGLDPSLLGNISFQLSFAAVAGIALLYPPLWDASLRLVEQLKLPAWAQPLAILLLGVLAVGLAATLATLPLLAFHFQRFSWLSIPLTVAMLPAFSPIILLTFLAGLVGLVAPAAAGVVGWADWVFLRSMVALVRPFEELPGASVSVGGFSPLVVWLYYGGLLAIAWVASRGRLLGHQATPGAGLASEVPWLPARPMLYLTLLLLLASVFVWTAVLRPSDGRLHVTVLDVGQGDAILVQSPQGHQVLVDGGRDGRVLLDHLSTLLPLGARRLDLVVVTHPDADHLDGLLALPEEYPIGAVLDPKIPTDNPSYAQWKRLLQEEGVQVLTARAGMTVRLGDVELEVLNPPEPLLKGTARDANNNAVVIRVRYQRATFLLTADIQEEAEAFLVRHAPGLPSAVLKVPHHGGATSSTGPFLKAVAPLVAVISVGADNSYGHPDPRAVARLKETGALLVRTSEHGSVELISDGMTLWVRTER